MPHPPCNECLARLMGQPVSELIGMPRFARCGKRSSGKDQPFARAIESRRREDRSNSNIRARGCTSPSTRCSTSSGAPTGAVHIVSDITEKRRLEDQFRESQKFETIGTLAAGVAHDFNNLLTSIMGNASLIASDLPAGFAPPRKAGRHSAFQPARRRPDQAVAGVFGQGPPLPAEGGAFDASCAGFRA